MRLKLLEGQIGSKSFPYERTVNGLSESQGAYARDEHEQAPAFIEADLVVHCGPTPAGELARTLTASTDVFTG
jgi:hypothetical protein